MTGAYYRIKTESGWENIEIDEMTDVQLDELANQYPLKGWDLAKFLAKWIRDNVGTLEPQ